MTVADYLGYRGTAKREAARKYVDRNAIPKKWRGKAWLVKPAGGLTAVHRELPRCCRNYLCRREGDTCQITAFSYS